MAYIKVSARVWPSIGPIPASAGMGPMGGQISAESFFTCGFLIHNFWADRIRRFFGSRRARRDPQNQLFLVRGHVGSSHRSAAPCCFLPAVVVHLLGYVNHLDAFFVFPFFAAFTIIMNSELPLGSRAGQRQKLNDFAAHLRRFEVGRKQLDPHRDLHDGLSGECGSRRSSHGHADDGRAILATEDFRACSLTAKAELPQLMDTFAGAHFHSFGVALRSELILSKLGPDLAARVRRIVKGANIVRHTTPFAVHSVVCWSPRHYRLPPLG